MELGIRRHWSYLKFLLKHRWYVFIECCSARMVWKGLVHDLSKFLPDEWFPYARYFYSKDGKKKQRRDSTGYYKPPDTGDSAFDLAWLKHLRRNPHHWQWWLLPLESGSEKPLEMPIVFLLEMICDWIGAARIQGVERWWDLVPWYHKNKDKLQLHSETRKEIERIIDYRTIIIGNEGNGINE